MTNPPQTFPVRVVIRAYAPHDWDEPTPDLDLSTQPVIIDLACPPSPSCSITPYTMDTFCHDLAFAIQDVVSPENPYHSPDGLFLGGDAWPPAACLHYRAGSVCADSKWVNEETWGERIEFMRSASKNTPGWVVVEVFVKDGEWTARNSEDRAMDVTEGILRAAISNVEGKRYSDED